MSLVFERTPGMPQAGMLALGDSYTIGEGVSESARWPVQLAHMPGLATGAVPAVRIIARTGWTTDELSAAIDAEAASGALEPEYRRVSLLIGVNNQYRGRDVGTYQDDHAALLDRAIGLAGGDPARVFAVSIPDWGVTAFGAADPRGPARIGAEIDAFNAAAVRNCQRRGVPFIDITPISRAHPDWVVADGLHPDARQYQAWATLVAERLAARR